MTKIPIFIKQASDLTTVVLFNLRACLDCFNWDDSYDINGTPLIISALQSILDDESIATEMAMIATGKDEEGIEEKYIDGEKNINVIIMSYGDDEMVLNEKIAIQFIIDWCAKYATHPDVPALCDKLKEKYGL